MKTFGLFLHPRLNHPQRVYILLEQLRADYGYSFFVEAEQRNLVPDWVQSYDPNTPKAAKLDAILVFGGDGTILRAKKLALATGAPILGINLGYLGFLSETTLAEIQASLETFARGKFKLLSRMLLACEVRRDKRLVFSDLALNDAVIYKAATPRLINVKIFNNHRYVLDTRCDGIIAASPTGSTAYSLSAGGPILSPEMKAIILAPLNPHLLTIRPMVFPASDRLMMRVYSMDEAACLQIDGINSLYMQEMDELQVTAAKRSVDFIKLSNRTFYQILRTKLNLGK